MLASSNFEKGRIDELAGEYNMDPLLLEKLLRALYLLEMLRSEGVEFIFKGGTALVLILSRPRRLSIDLDILTQERSERIKGILDRIVKGTDFLRWEIDERPAHSDLQKEHFKLYFPCKDRGGGDEGHILLDVQYERSPYEEAIGEFPVEAPFFDGENNPMRVQAPTKEALLGDKLTAFAPNTTGVPQGAGKELDIIKQLYDIGHLFDEMEDLATVRAVHEKVASIEVSYRKLSIEASEVLEDSFQTSLLIGSHGNAGSGDLRELQRGSRKMGSHTIGEAFSYEKAMVPAAKAAYLAMLVRTETTTFSRYSGPEEVRELQIQDRSFSKLNKLKRTHPEAFFYWYKALELRDSVE